LSRSKAGRSLVPYPAMPVLRIGTSAAMENEVQGTVMPFGPVFLRHSVEGHKPLWSSASKNWQNIGQANLNGERFYQGALSIQDHFHWRSSSSTAISGSYHGYSVAASLHAIRTGIFLSARRATAFANNKSPSPPEVVLFPHMAAEAFSRPDVDGPQG